MNKYNPNIHHRRSIRLKGYDYSKAGLYFITICCQNRIHLFGEVTNKGEMALNIFGKTAHEEWLQTEHIRPNCRLHNFIIMPDHIHGIIEILFKKEKEIDTGESGDGEFRFAKDTDKFRFAKDTGELRFAKDTDKFRFAKDTGELRFAPTTEFKSPSQTIGAIIRGFKIATIKKIKELTIGAENREWKKIKALDFKIWQRNYYESIIRNEQAYHRISEYIINNPAKWNKDKFTSRANSDSPQ